MALTKMRYKGLSDVRSISKKEWADIGVTVDASTVWEARNAWTVYVESPSDAMLEQLKREGNITVSEVGDGDNPIANDIITASPDAADDTGKTVVDKNAAKGEEAKQAAAAKK